MSSMMTPRPGTQATNRSRTRTGVPPNAEQKTKRSGNMFTQDKMTTSTSSDRLSEKGDITKRSISTERLSTKGDFSARSVSIDRFSSKGDISIRSDDEPEVAQSKPDVADMPFFKQDQFTDVVLQVGGRKLFTCRSILAYNSPVMAKILSSGPSRNKDLDLPEKELEDVIELLAYLDPRVDFIITGESTIASFPLTEKYDINKLNYIELIRLNFSEQSAIALLPLAEEYEISGLKSLCEQTIMQSYRRMKRGKRQGPIPVEINLEYLHIADKYDFSGLRNLVTDEFVNNEDQSHVNALLTSTLISENVKISVMEKKLEKISFELDKERRERTAIETKLDDYGHKRFRKPLPE